MYLLQLFQKQSINVPSYDNVKFIIQMDLKAISKVKDQGNDYFKDKKFEEAIAKFNQCISNIQKQQSKEFLIKQTQLSKLYVVCLINSSLSCINLKKKQFYDMAIGYCDKALSIDPENIKGLYRRGLARKQKAEIIQRQEGVKQKGLLEIYEKSREDFQKLCLVDKTNELATKTLKQIMNDIYRVTVGRGEDAFKSKNAPTEKKQQKQQASKPEVVKKRGADMNKIMQQYKVQQVTNIVQEKVRSHYLTNDLPSLRSEFQKALRTLQKSEDTYIEFIYRFNEEYLSKINPTFDTLSNLVKILIKKGDGVQAKNVFLAIKKQKSFKLLWKSYGPKQKQQILAKWKELGLSQEQVQI